eukprot:CAMPEP_0174267920 /NCGR_PEP_ID=MMETSP0439-20130205/35429_1 /TAXON_ID=0 /ORGANISM="Stereomyxa ramosa, Strain Chinc5" /LENGTH=292 /DNA_ID=CAMNT_0015355737 /DNA_START=74 /DNA_END=952 /DNA_ORIENTATION=+
MKTEGASIEDDFELLEELGSGNFSKVYLGKHKATGTEYAIKVVDKKQVDSEKLVTEIEILKKVSHPNIIALFEVYDSDPEKLYMVLELVSGGELFNKIVEIGSYSENVAKSLVRQIVNAVKYLHDKNIAHRDIKPTNLLLSGSDSTEIKLADFGLSKILGPDSMMQTACGTPIFVAPEVLMGEGYDKAVDCWGIGIIMYILLCGYPPFFDDGENMSELFDQILTGSFEFADPYWTDISDEAKDLISRLLVVDHSARYTTEECLNHPWIKSEVGSDKELTDFTTQLKKFVSKD